MYLDTCLKKKTNLGAKSWVGSLEYCVSWFGVNEQAYSDHLSQEESLPFWNLPLSLDYEVTGIWCWLLGWCPECKIRVQDSSKARPAQSNPVWIRGLVVRTLSRDVAWRWWSVKNINQPWSDIQWWPCASHCGVDLVPSTYLAGNVQIIGALMDKYHTQQLLLWWGWSCYTSCE